jgi:hypothetical protein
MAIKHPFTNPKADGVDATIVRPSNWNADHTIENDTVTYAHLQNVSATDKVLGRSTGGAGDIEEIACTAAGRSVIGAATAGDQRTALGLAAIAATGSGADLVAGTVPLTAIANIAAARVVGSIAGGAPAELTASQIFDLVSDVNGVLLTRTAGSWAVLANVGTDGGDLIIAAGTPTTPAADKVKISASTVGGGPLFQVTDPDGFTAQMQPWFGTKRVLASQAQANATGQSLIGMAALSVSGTPTARAMSTASFLGPMPRLGAVSPASSGSVCGVRLGVLQIYRGDAAARGGFRLVLQWNTSDAVLVTDARMFAGVIASASAPTDVEPSTLSNLIGVGCNGGDTTMQLYAAGAVAQSRTDLGANFPVNTTSIDVYRLHLYCPPNGADVRWQLDRLNSGHTTSGTISNAANLPASTTLLGAQVYRTNNATAAACAVDWHKFVCTMEN